MRAFATLADATGRDQGEPICGSHIERPSGEDAD
jgi:hypothetical protein